jgi:hypothetical protein
LARKASLEAQGSFQWALTGERGDPELQSAHILLREPWDQPEPGGPTWTIKAQRFPDRRSCQVVTNANTVLPYKVSSWREIKVRVVHLGPRKSEGEPGDICSTQVLGAIGRTVV